MTRYLNLYWYFLIQRLKVLMEYRLSFILGASSTVVWQASSIAAVWIVMQKVPSLNGWNYDEVLLVYGLVTLSKSINHMFADNLWTLGRIYTTSVRAGSIVSSSARLIRCSICWLTVSVRMGLGISWSASCW
ncbi:MAG TPA: ABC-2 family transporter protein [Anaerolineales bacterium]|nr:ABC-2 family transporter protein [Anaerolineales bacterium]